MSQPMKAHAGDFTMFRLGHEPRFEMRADRKQMDGSPEPPAQFPQCSFCGSIDIEGAIEALSTPGTKYSGSDWKYGYPHKFYLDVPCAPHRFCCTRGPGENDFGYTTRTKLHYKFYTEHLLDASPEQLERFNAVAKDTLGITFHLDDEGKLLYRSPGRGYQAWGEVAHKGLSDELPPAA